MEISVEVNLLPWKLEASMQVPWKLVEASVEVDLLPWKLVEFTSMEISMEVNLRPWKLEASMEVDLIPWK